MKTQSKHHIVAAILVIATVLLFWILSARSMSLARVFDSPLATPAPMNLTFRSPLLSPTLDPALAPSGPRVPREIPELRTPEPYPPTPDTFSLPLDALASTLEPQAYLPTMLRNHPLQLFYGSKGLSGADSFGLFSENYNVYYTWSVNPSRSDTRFARMVFCVDDYHLYVDYDGPNHQDRIIQAAQADRGTVIGRVWLIFNEPDDTWGAAVQGSLPKGQCGVWPYTGDPTDPENNPSLLVFEEKIPRRRPGDTAWSTTGSRPTTQMPGCLREGYCISIRQRDATGGRLF